MISIWINRYDQNIFILLIHYFYLMKPLFRKKLFLEVYFPIAIVAGLFITLITGWSLIIGLGLGVILGILIQFIIYKRKESSILR